MSHDVTPCAVPRPSIAQRICWKLVVANVIYAFLSPPLFEFLLQFTGFQSTYENHSVVDVTFVLQQSYLIYRHPNSSIILFILFTNSTVTLTAVTFVVRLYIIRYTWRLPNKSEKMLTICAFFAIVTLLDIWLGFSDDKAIYTLSVRKPLAIDLLFANIIIVAFGITLGELLDQTIGLIVRKDPFETSYRTADVPETER